jgi:hypothetical protein
MGNSQNFGELRGKGNVGTWRVLGMENFKENWESWDHRSFVSRGTLGTWGNI